MGGLRKRKQTWADITVIDATFFSYLRVSLKPEILLMGTKGYYI
jgi:hypothetical protein